MITLDAIIALMKRAYNNGYERGYAAGRERRGLLADEDLDIAFKDGQQAGYLRGKEDGYDEACMDLTDDDLCGAPDRDCEECFGASFNDCDECRGLPAEVGRQTMAKGIFIEGMQRPKECSRRCPFADQLNYDCILIPGSERFNSFDEQFARCPIQEVEISVDGQ